MRWDKNALIDRRCNGLRVSGFSAVFSSERFGQSASHLGQFSQDMQDMQECAHAAALWIESNREDAGD